MFSSPRNSPMPSREVLQPGKHFQFSFATSRHSAEFHCICGRVPRLSRFKRQSVFMIYRFARSFWLACAISACVFLAVGLCVAAPPDVLDETHPAVRAVIAVQDEVTPELLQQPEILGTAVGVDAVGN